MAMTTAENEGETVKTIKYLYLLLAITPQRSNQKNSPKYPHFQYNTYKFTLIRRYRRLSYQKYLDAPLSLLFILNILSIRKLIFRD